MNHFFNFIGYENTYDHEMSYIYNFQDSKDKK